MPTMIKPRAVVIDFPYISLAGIIGTQTYGDGTTALVLLTDEGPETLSTNLGGHGLTPRSPEHVFVKDYSEHTGLAQSLVKADVAEIVAEVTFGNFGTRAYEVRLLG